MLKSRPDLYTDIHLRLDPREEARSPSVGGLLGDPDLGRSYLLAARMTIERAAAEDRLRDVALPVVYLQRHAFEVELKDLLATVFAIQTDTAWLEALRRDETAEPGPRPEVPPVHDFEKLLVLLRPAINSIGHGPVPVDIETMASRLREVERVDGAVEPTRSRYLRLRGGRRSFAEPTQLHVVETQEKLEDLFARFFRYQHEEYENPNLTTGLVHSGAGLEQSIVQLIGIDRAYGP